MKVLIVGCGYVGMELGSELVREGHEVFGVRRSGSAAGELSSRLIKPVVANIAYGSDLSRLPLGCDWIVACVSASGGGVDEYRRVYVEGMAHLLEWLEGQSPQKFVYTSSTGVYGQDDGSEVTEESATAPGSDTGKILAEAEQLVLKAARRKGFPGVILRLAGIYGPGRGYWLKQFLSGDARLEGTGERMLNMIHRDDVAGAIIAAMNRGQAGSVYNVVDNEPVSQRAQFEWLAAVLGRELPASSSLTEPSKRGATNKSVSNRRLRSELKYELKYSTFREGYAAELKRLGVL